MAFQKLQFKPGIVDDVTNYTNLGGWYDCDKIRFRKGYPEKIGGWVQYDTDASIIGTVRAIYPYVALDGYSYLALGTSKKYYIETNGTLEDITPIRKTVDPMSNNPFTTGGAGTTVVIVSDTAHGAVDGCYVTFSGATGPIDGIPADEINREHVITYIDANSYSITVDTPCSAGSTAGGGAVVVAEYQINISYDVVSPSVGWGNTNWSYGNWGSSNASIAPSIRTWSQSNYGEDLVFNYRAGGVFYMDKDQIGLSRSVWLKDLPGAVSPIESALYVMVSDQRHVVGFGANDIGSSTIDPLLVRWASKESLIDWYPQITNSAGSYRLTGGSAIISAKQSKREVLIWTDTNLYSMQYIGAPYTYGFNSLSDSVSIAAPNAVVMADDVAFWMGVDQFYIYDGRVQELPCDVKRHVFSNLNKEQLFQTTAGINKQFSEIIWFYRSTATPSDPNMVLPDKYVIYNYADKIWYYGSITRTAWADSVYPFNYPLAGASGDIYFHEHGVNDLSDINNPQPIEAYITSSDIEIGDGERFAFISKLIPDVTFANSTAGAPAVDITLSVRRNPGANYHEETPSGVTRSATVPVEQFTEQAWVRLRGRSLQFKISSDSLGTNWQLGVPRIDWKPDGKR